MDFESGQFVGRYQLLKRLAVGGMGEVYLASQTGPEGFERFVVVKRMIPATPGDDDPVSQFVGEARLVAKLTHRNIAQIHELGRDEDGYFLAMEYVKGPSLRGLLDRLSRLGQRLPAAYALDIVTQVADALAYAYTAPDDLGAPMRIVHRDVTPENILVSIAGDVKLIDFGVAKSALHKLATQSGGVKGKLTYMSPEQASGKPLDGRSDLFSLGIVFCELLTGKNPFFSGGVVETIYAIQNDRPHLPSDSDASLAPFDAVVSRLLARWPTDRPPDANHVYDELVTLRGQIPPAPVRLGQFISEHFGADIASLTRTFSDPKVRQALHTGLTGLVLRPSDEGSIAGSATIRSPPPVHSASENRTVALPPKPDVTISGSAEAWVPAVPWPQRAILFAFAAIAGFGIVVGGVAYTLLHQPSGDPTVAAPSAPTPLPAQETAAVQPASVVGTPQPPLDLAASPPPAPMPPLSSSPSEPPPLEIEEPLNQPLSPRSIAVDHDEGAEPARPAATRTHTPRAGHGHVASGSDRKSLSARLRRVEAAWERQRAKAPPGDVRVFDLTLANIRGLLASAKEDEMEEAKNSLDEFVANALGGEEP
jgi:serine/threonine protein kinase